LESRGVGTVRTTLGDYLADWLAEKVRTIEPTTALGYTRWGKHILRTPAAAIPLDRLTPRDLEQAYAQLLERPAGRGRPLVAASLRHIHAFLQNALNDALRHRLVDSNPAAHAKPPRGQSPKVAVPTPEQIGRVLDDLTQNAPDLGALALLLIGGGLRRSEALGLRWKDIDWNGRRIAIRQTVIEYGTGLALREGVKSLAGRRTISIAPSIIEALRQQQGRVAELPLKIGRHWQDHDLVFPDVNGGPRRPTLITKAFARAAKRACWPAHSSPTHSLRHAAASYALAQGVDLATVAKRLGHSSPAVTARIYLSADAERDQAAGEVMAAIPRRKAEAEAIVTPCNGSHRGHSGNVIL
jgi:integrase